MPTEAQTQDTQLSPEEAGKQAQAIWNELDQEDQSIAAGDPPPEKAEPTPAAKAVEQAPVPAPQVGGLSDQERAMLGQIPDLVNAVKTTIGRVGSLQSELVKIGNAAAVRADDSPTQHQIEKAAASKAKWEALQKDFPDWAEGVEALVSSRVPSTPSIDWDKEVGARVAAALQPIQGDAAAREAIKQELAIEVVEAIDENWKEVPKHPQFDTWLKTKDAAYQHRANNSWKPTDVLRVIRDFRKEVVDTAPAAKPNKLSQAALPRGTSKVNIQKPVEEMDANEYWHYLDEQDRRAERAA